MVISGDVSNKYQKKPSQGKVLLIGTIVVLVLAVGILAFLLLNKDNSNSGNNNTTATSTTSTTTKTTTPTSSVTASTTTTTTTTVSGTTSPTTTTTTTANTGPQTYKDTVYDFSITYPGDWSVDTSKTVQRDCLQASNFMKTPCASGSSVTVERLSVISPETSTATNNSHYGLNFSGATGGLGFTCGSDKETSFYATIKGTKYDFQTCVNSAGEYYSMADLKIPGSNSNWNTVNMTFLAKDRAMMDTILDALVSIR